MNQSFAHPPLANFEEDAADIRESAYARYSPYLVCAYCAAAALSIAASQIFVVSLSLWWIIDAKRSQRATRDETHLALALSFFMMCSLVAAALGLHPSRALVDSAKLGFALLFPFVVASTLDPSVVTQSQALARIERYVLAFCFGQSIAAIHSICSAFRGEELPIGIPGAVTESGQLVLLLPVLSAMSLYAYRTHRRHSEWDPTLRTRRVTILAVLGLGLLIAWPQLLFSSRSGALQVVALLGILSLVLGLLFAGIRRAKQVSSDFEQTLFIRYQPLFLGLFVLTTIINLKRGPWLGIFVSLLLLGVLYSKRLIAYSVILTALTLGLIRPAQERLLAFASHFSIAGGRQNMWEIGLELIQRYPLGIGLDNARFMRVLDPSLPLSHRHMHNNFLNVAVETGFIGLACYLWMFVVVALLVAKIYRAKSAAAASQMLKIISVGLGVALLGWQVSGIVEYNFGDGEIRLIALTFIGIILAIGRHELPADSSRLPQ